MHVTNNAAGSMVSAGKVLYNTHIRPTLAANVYPCDKPRACDAGCYWDVKSKCTIVQVLNSARCR